MSKTLILLLLTPIFLTIFAVSNGCPENFKLPYVEKQTHLSFYFFEITAGAPNASDFIVAGANRTAYAFTDVSVYDVPLRQTENLNSEMVGQVHGIAAYASMVDLSAVTSENIVFTSGEYNGSTLSILGWMPNNTDWVERPVVGGTGYFRLARGSAFTKVLTISSSLYVVKFDVHVLHY